MSEKLRTAVQLVLALHEQTEEPEMLRRGWIVKLDPMAEAQLRAALAEPEQDIPVTITWSQQDAKGNCPYPGDGGETQPTMLPADLIDMILHGKRDDDGTVATSVLIFTAVPPPLAHPAWEDCLDEECSTCAERDCPHGEPLHYHHDGCPACDAPSALIHVASLRALQHAANGLSYHQFCEALGWPEDDYSKAKFLEFQALGRLHVFDDGVLSKTIEYNQSRLAKQARINRDFGLEADHAAAQ